MAIWRFLVQSGPIFDFLHGLHLHIHPRANVVGSLHRGLLSRVSDSLRAQHGYINFNFMVHRHPCECARVQLTRHSGVSIQRAKSYIVYFRSRQRHGPGVGDISGGVLRNELSCPTQSHLLPLLSHAPAAMEEQFIAVGRVATRQEANNAARADYCGGLCGPLVSHSDDFAAEEPWRL